MKKRFAACAAIIMAVLLCVPMFGCSLVTVNEEKDMARIAAKVGDINVTKKEVNDLYEQYLPYASMMGADVSTAAGREAMVGFIMEDILADKMLQYQARAKGFYEFDEERRAAIDANVADALSTFVDEARAMAEAEFAEDPDIDVDARTAEYIKEFTLSDIGQELDEAGLKDFLKDYFEKADAIQAMMDDVYGKISITEDEVKAAYDTRLASDKTLYAETPGDYGLLREDADMDPEMIPPLFTPEGYIRVRVIEVAPEGEISVDYDAKKQEIQALTMELGGLSVNEADQEANAVRMAEIRANIQTLETEAENLFAGYLAPAKTKIDEAYAKLEGGADFVETLLAYDADGHFTDNETFKQKGMLLSNHEGDESWPQPVKDAALKLTAPGAYTQVIESAEEGAYGYYIVQFVGREPAGEVGYADVRAAVEAETLEAKRAGEWNTLVEEWMADTTLITRYDDVIKSVGVN